MLGELISRALGLGLPSEALGGGQMVARALVVFVYLLVVVRLGHRRFASRSTAFDLVVVIVLGSVASRAISGTAPFGPTLVTVAALLAFHWVIAAATFHWHRLGALVKGKPAELVRDGKELPAAMRHSHITRHDLEEALRQHGVAALADVVSAHLERDGNISVLSGSARADPVH